MKWNLVDIDKETDHKFLNFYTLHYEVENDGTTRPYSYFMASRHEKEGIRAFNHDYTRPDGVVMALVDERGEEPCIYLTTQFRPPLGTYMTSFPAGLLDSEDTDIFEAAKREAREEAGLEVGDFEILCTPAPTSSGLSDEMNAFVLAKVKAEARKELEDFEDIAGGLFPLSKIKEMMKDPKYIIPVPVRLTLLLLIERYKA